MIRYYVGADSLERTDISGLLSMRKTIEEHGLWEFYWEVIPNDGEDHSDIPEVRHYLIRLLEDWPEILRYCGPWAVGMIVACTCKRGAWDNNMSLVTYTPFFLRALKRAGLREDHIF